MIDDHDRWSWLMIMIDDHDRWSMMIDDHDRWSMIDDDDDVFITKWSIYCPFELKIWLSESSRRDLFDGAIHHICILQKTSILIETLIFDFRWSMMMMTFCITKLSMYCPFELQIWPSESSQRALFDGAIQQIRILQKTSILIETLNFDFRKIFFENIFET